MNLYWGVKFGALAHYIERWNIRARFFGVTLARRVFIGALVADRPSSNEEER